MCTDQSERGSLCTLVQNFVRTKNVWHGDSWQKIGWFRNEAQDRCQLCLLTTCDRCPACQTSFISISYFIVFLVKWNLCGYWANVKTNVLNRWKNFPRMIGREGWMCGLLTLWSSLVSRGHLRNPSILDPILIQWIIFIQIMQKTVAEMKSVLPLSCPFWLNLCI